MLKAKRRRPFRWSSYSISTRVTSRLNTRDTPASARARDRIAALRAHAAGVDIAAADADALERRRRRRIGPPAPRVVHFYDRALRVEDRDVIVERRQEHAMQLGHAAPRTAHGRDAKHRHGREQHEQLQHEDVLVRRRRAEETGLAIDGPDRAERDGSQAEADRPGAEAKRRPDQHWERRVQPQSQLPAHSRRESGTRPHRSTPIRRRSPRPPPPGRDSAAGSVVARHTLRRRCTREES